MLLEIIGKRYIPSGELRFRHRHHMVVMSTGRRNIVIGLRLDQHWSEGQQ